MLRGRLEDLYQANAVIFDLVGVEKLSEGRKTPLDVGDIFEINDHEVRIVGFARLPVPFSAILLSIRLLTAPCKFLQKRGKTSPSSLFSRL